MLAVISSVRVHTWFLLCYVIVCPYNAVLLLLYCLYCYISQLESGSKDGGDAIKELVLVFSILSFQLNTLNCLLYKNDFI